MESTLTTYILIGVIAILGWLVVDEKYINPAEARTKTDTVRVNKPFKVETIKPADSIIPETVTLWKTEYKEIQSLELVGDTVKVFVDSSESKPLIYDTRFLTNYGYAPKLLDLSITENNLSFTGMTPNGLTQTSEWSLNLGKSHYRLVPDGKGWVGLEADRASGWLGLDLKFSHSIGVGNEWVLGKEGLNSHPYVLYSPTLQIKDQISLESSVGFAPELIGSIGIGYQL